MISSFIKRLAKQLALRNLKYLSLYRKVCNPSGTEWAEMYRRHRILHAMGNHCSIIPDTHLDMPHLISLGDNVRLASCTLLCHDGIINMLERRFGGKLEAVGPIKIGNNVFIGHGAIVLRGVTIGNDVVVASRSVVTKDLPTGYVYGGIPAKPIMTTEKLYQRISSESKSLPWFHLIEGRQGGFDAALEPELDRQRVKYFFDTDQ